MKGTNEIPFLFIKKTTENRLKKKLSDLNSCICASQTDDESKQYNKKKF